MDFSSTNIDQSKTKTIIIGHRNPDTDSVAAAVALAELKKLKGIKNVSAACAGLPSARTEYIFRRLNAPLPEVKNDIHLKVEDIMTVNRHVKCPP